MKKINFIIGIILVIILSALAFAQNETDNSTSSASTATDNTIIPPVVEPEAPPAEPSIACDATQCDDECVTCSDDVCHSPDFVCIEKFEIDKITPKTTGIGINQLNILIKNTGNVDLYSIGAEASGEGIVSLERTGIDKLAAGDKDYAFVKINATKSGVIKLFIELYMKGSRVNTVVDQINITEEKAAVVEEDFNPTQLATSLTALKQMYKNIETDYITKKEEGYNVDLVYDNLKATSDDLKNTQIYLSGKDYKRASISISVINESLNDISSDLKNAKKKNVALMDKIKNNMVYIGSIAAAVISVFGAWTLIRSKSKEHIDKLKTIKIPKIHLKKKEEKKEEHKEAKKEKKAKVKKVKHKEETTAEKKEEAKSEEKKD